MATNLATETNFDYYLAILRDFLATRREDRVGNTRKFLSSVKQASKAAYHSGSARVVRRKSHKFEYEFLISVGNSFLFHFSFDSLLFFRMAKNENV